MTHNKLLLYALLYISDSIAIGFLQRLLKDFLIGARNRKIAKEIYSKQSLMNRISLGFISHYLSDYLVEFRIYHTLYIIEILTLLPQYIILLTIDSNNHLYACIAIKSLLFIYIRTRFDSSLRSKYRKGK